MVETIPKYMQYSFTSIRIFKMLPMHYSKQDYYIRWLHLYNATIASPVICYSYNRRYIRTQTGYAVTLAQICNFSSYNMHIYTIIFVLLSNIKLTSV